MMTNILESIGCFSRAEPIFHSCQSARTVFVTIGHREIGWHVELGVLYMYRVGRVGGNTFDVRAVLWVKTRHVNLLYLLESLNVPEEDCLVLHNRSLLEQSLFLLSLDLIANALSKQTVVVNTHTCQ